MFRFILVCLVSLYSSAVFSYECKNLQIYQVNRPIKWTNDPARDVESAINWVDSKLLLKQQISVRGLEARFNVKGTGTRFNYIVLKHVMCGTPWTSYFEWQGSPYQSAELDPTYVSTWQYNVYSGKKDFSGTGWPGASRGRPDPNFTVILKEESLP